MMHLIFFALFISLYRFALVSNAFGSNMVLQRAPEHANIYGWDKPNSINRVSVQISGLKSYVTNSRLDGFWEILLDPTQADNVPRTITVQSTSGEQQQLQNVLFGDVFVCSGQSNMQMTVSQVFNATEEILKAQAYPRIRVMTVGQGTISQTPLNQFLTIEQHWAQASSASIGVGNWSAFSATCWFFGKNLYDQNKIPLGLISSNWGGTIVQAWSSPQALAKCKSENNEKKRADPNQPSVLWNAMIIPILNTTIKGAVWYQGESNSGAAKYYSCAFPAMISDWRQKWGGGTSKTFGFYYVQLAPWKSDNKNNEFNTRIAQDFALKLPSVGLAVAMDLGDPTSPFGDIHPRDKQTVGKRLALSARGITYGQKIQYLGPAAESYTSSIQGNLATVTVFFKKDTIGSGLELRTASCEVPNNCAGFEICLNSVWTGTSIWKLHGSDGLEISTLISGQPQICGVRYADANYPLCYLYNKDDLPALPFSLPMPF